MSIKDDAELVQEWANDDTDCTSQGELEAIERVAGFPERLGILHENGNVWDVDIVKLKPVVDSRCWPEWTKRLHAKLMDDLRHAPLCPANHYHGSRTPTGQCSCGAVAVTESDV